MAHFECNKTPRKETKQFAPNNHILEAIRYRLATFNLPHAITEKLLDILLVYGEGFHRRLFDILQQCDGQQTSKRSPIVHQLLTKRERTQRTRPNSPNSEEEAISSIKHKEITCKLALSIWTLFLKMIQHCLLSYSASGHLSENERNPEIELQVVIRDFLEMSKSAEMAADQTKKALNTEISECKRALSELMESYTAQKAVQSRYKSQLSTLQESVHQKSISCDALKSKISSIQSEKAEMEREASYLKSGSELIQIRSDQLYKKRMELKEQNDRLQSATDHLRNKIEFYTEECCGYRKQYEALTQIVGQHEAKMKGKVEELEALKADYWILQRENMELQQQRIKREATTTQFESQRDALNEKREIDAKALYNLERIIASEEGKERTSREKLDDLKASMKSMDEQQSSAKEKLTKMRLELDAKCAVLTASQQELDDGQKALESVEREIESLKVAETKLNEECQRKRMDLRTEQDERDRFSWIYKEKLAELNAVETVMIGHSKKVNGIEAEIGGLQRQISEMKGVCDSMQNEFERQEKYIIKETAEREKEIADRRECVVRILDDIEEHRKALDALNEELFVNEKRYTDALTVFHIEKRHLKALRATKMRCGVQYNQLLEDHKKLERAIRVHDREMTELDHKMQQQLIDTNEWKSKIYAVSSEFDRTIKERCTQIERLRTRQSKMGEAIIAKDRELVSIRREHQMEITSIQKRNQSQLVALESELEELSQRPFVCNVSEQRGGGVEEFVNDERALEEKRECIALMKRGISAKKIQHLENEAEVEVLKEQNKDLSNDWETTKLCKEHLTKELGELNEYEAQLMQKLKSLESEFAGITRIPRGRTSVAVGTTEYSV